MKTPRFEILEETDEYVLLRDLGPWDEYPTITNRAEEVVELLAPMLRGRRLEYIDSSGDRDQIIVINGEFRGFGPRG
jgi:hypothetical protein